MLCSRRRMARVYAAVRSLVVSEVAPPRGESGHGQVCITEFTDPGCPWAYSRRAVPPAPVVAVRRRPGVAETAAWSARDAEEYERRGFTTKKGAGKYRWRGSRASRRCRSIPASHPYGRHHPRLPGDRRGAPLRDRGGADAAAAIPGALLLGRADRRARDDRRRGDEPGSIRPCSRAWSAGDDVAAALTEGTWRSRASGCRRRACLTRSSRTGPAVAATLALVRESRAPPTASASRCPGSSRSRCTT